MPYWLVSAREYMPAMRRGYLWTGRSQHRMSGLRERNVHQHGRPNRMRAMSHKPINHCLLHPVPPQPLLLNPQLHRMHCLWAQHLHISAMHGHHGHCLPPMHRRMPRENHHDQVLHSLQRQRLRPRVPTRCVILNHTKTCYKLNTQCH